MTQYKKIYKICSILVLSLLFTSCMDEDPIKSTITNFPTFQYDELAVVALGGSYTPLATATEGGVDITVTTKGTVDTNTVGVYVLTFEATNSDGFNGMVTQTVVVHDPSIVGTDVSGDIQDSTRTTRTAVISLVPGTTSIFFCTDFAFGGTFPMYFQMNGDVISEVAQSYVFGVASVDLTYDNVAKTFTTKVNPQGFAYGFEYQ